MTTLRQAHKKSFTVITNKLAQDNSLSLRARGLMLYLLSLPDDWKIHIWHLVKIMKEGREAITTTIQELKEAKYIHHHKMGFKDGWQYFVFEAPTQEDAFKEFLRTIRVFEEFGKPNSSGNQQLQKTNSKYKRNSSSQKAPPPKPEEDEEESPPEELQELDKRYEESVAYAKAQGKRPPVRSPKWNATTLKDIRKAAKIAPKATGSTIEANKAYSHSLSSKAQQDGSNRFLRVDALNSHIEIAELGSNHVDCIGYDDKNFRGKVMSALSKRGFGGCALD